jgi:hypothetical protein
MGWNELPVEIIEAILSQVFQPDLPSLRFISRATNHALCPIFWKHKVLCVEWNDLKYLDEIMESVRLSYPLSHVVTGLEIRRFPFRSTDSTAKGEATRQHKTLSSLIARVSDKGRGVQDAVERAIIDAGLELLYRVVRKFTQLRILRVPSFDELFPPQPSPSEPSIVTHSTLYPFRNVEELRLNGLYLNRRDGKVSPGDLTRCLLDFPYLKTLVAHVQVDGESVSPVRTLPNVTKSSLRHLELTVAKIQGNITYFLIEFIQLTKDLETFVLADRTSRRTMHGFSNSFVFQPGDTNRLNIPFILDYLSGSHKTLVRLEIIQYDPLNDQPREPISISFQPFTALQRLVLPFTPRVPTEASDLQSFPNCFPSSLTSVTFLRGTKLTLNEFRSIIHLLRGQLRDLGAYVSGDNAQVCGIVDHFFPKRHTIIMGDYWKGANWTSLQVLKPKELRVRLSGA